jgi:hypothetical protein
MDHPTGIFTHDFLKKKANEHAVFLFFDNLQSKNGTKCWV